MSILIEEAKEKLINQIKLYNEQVFYRTGRLPINSEVQETFSRELALNNLDYYDVLPHIIKWLKDTGLLEQDLNQLLEPKQFLVAQAFLNTADRRSIRQKLKELGVTVKEFDNWRRSPNFMAYLEKEAKRRFGDAHIYADLELTKHIEDGNLEGIKYYHQLTGRYSSPEAVNVAKVLATMMEILVQYVSADVLSKVAKELESRIYGSLKEQSKEIEASSMEITFDH